MLLNSFNKPAGDSLGLSKATPPVSVAPNQSNTTGKAPKLPRETWTWRRIGIIAGIVIWTFAGFMLAQAIGLAGIWVLQALGVPLADVSATTFNTVVNIIIYSLAIVIILGVPKLVKKRPTTKEDLGVQRYPQLKDVAWLFAGAITYLILTLIVTSFAMVVFPSGDYTEAQEIGFAGLTNNWEFILAFISLVIVAPVAEEVIFRGYMYGKLRKYAPVWLTVLLTSLLFAIAHFQWNVGLDTFALGVVLALLRFATGSIWASILLHMLKNGVAFYLLFVNPPVL